MPAVHASGAGQDTAWIGEWAHTSKQVGEQHRPEAGAGCAQVWADVCMPAGGSARYLHVDAIGNRLATTSEAVAVAPALMDGTPLL